MNEFEKNRKLERKFIKTAKCILGFQFVNQDIKKDLEEGIDFLTFSISPIKVGFRLRRFNYLKFKDEFTIRWSISSGNPTEIDKIRNGDIDYILYGFVNQEETKIIRYFIGDLTIFRDYEQGMMPKIYKNKFENDSELAVYSIKNFPSDFIVKNYKQTSELSGYAR